MNVSKIKIAIKNSLTLTLTLLIQEMIQIGVIKVVKTIKSIDIPSTPNLNLIKPDIGRVVMAVANGIGVMPAYEGLLSSQEIEAVAKYVSEKSN